MEVRATTTVPHAEFFPPPRPSRGPGRWTAVLLRDREELVKFWPVVHNMVVTELRVRYQRSMLGFLWTLLHPILMMTILSVVFSQLFGVKLQDFAIYLFAGMMPWGFLQSSLNDASVCIIHSEGLIRKIYIPKLVFPLAKVLINLVTFLLSLVALFLLLKPLGAPISFAMLALPFAIGLFLMFTLGLSLIVATANTFFRDAAHLVTVFLQAWYYATPIIYKITNIPEAYRWRFWLNPVYPFIRMFQSILTYGEWPELRTFLMAALMAVLSLGVGYATFKSHEDKLVFRL